MNSKAVKAMNQSAIPKPNQKQESVGATMPYTRYDSGAAILGGGAVKKSSPYFYKNQIASQASEQSYITLPKKGAYAKWT
ncbi:MAG: hypothetical protein K6G85_04580, partial [Eubacterium sp.]|nr:hypothetical protein [Eubacterium sp.]